MKFDRTRQKINKIEIAQEAINTEIKNSFAIPVLKTPTFESAIKSRILYDSGWQESINEDIASAFTTTQNLELPQRATYQFDFTLNIEEHQLPFISYKLITETTEGQDVRGVGQFTYNGYRELSLNLYDWKGTTQVIDVLDLSPDNPSDNGFGYWVEEGATTIPLTLPAPTITPPSPTDCYETTSSFSTIAALSIGGGIGPYELSPDGSTVIISVGVEQSYADWIQSLFDTFNPMSGIINIYVTAYQTASFKHRINDFPIPLNEDGTEMFSLPCGDVDPAQWEFDTTATFDDLITLKGYTYQEAFDLFSEYYPEIYITPEDAGQPYKAFEVFESEVIESGKNTVQITKLKTGFEFKIFGDLLIISPANTETDFSDPLVPTYKPNADPINIKLLVFYHANKVETYSFKTYKV
jgi:hypothetical protein